jgi:hypothetical protein
MLCSDWHSVRWRRGLPVCQRAVYLLLCNSQIHQHSGCAYTNKLLYLLFGELNAIGLKQSGSVQNVSYLGLHDGLK